QELCLSRSAAEPPKGLQHWQIGFASPILLDALPPTEPDLLCRYQLRHKGVDQGGLAKARLSRQEDHLALSLARLGPPLLELRQLPLPPDQPRQGSWGIGEWRRGQKGHGNCGGVQ